jgi:hypothetical protein
MRKAMGVIVLCIFVIWIAISVFCGIGMATFVVDKVANDTFIEEELKFPADYQSIVIKSNFNKTFSYTKVRFFNEELYLESKTSQNQFYGITCLSGITYANDSIITVRISSNGKIVREFQNKIEMKDSVLYIPYLFPLRKGYWSGEEIRVQLFVPKGKRVIIEDLEWRKRFPVDMNWE